MAEIFESFGKISWQCLRLNTNAEWKFNTFIHGDEWKAFLLKEVGILKIEVDMLFIIQFIR